MVDHSDMPSALQVAQAVSAVLGKKLADQSASEIVLTRAGPKQKKNAYKFYRKACGRDARLKELWGDQAFSR